MPSAAAAFTLEPALHEAMIAARRHLHAHPELSNAEEKTQAYIRTWLEAQGLGDAKPVAGAGRRRHCGDPRRVDLQDRDSRRYRRLADLRAIGGTVRLA